MSPLEKIYEKIEETILSIAVLTMAAILIGGVISRSVFNVSWSFTEEVGQTLSIVVTFVGIGYCARKGRHITMSVFYDMANEKIKKILTLIINFFTAILMFYIAYLGIRYSASVQELGRVTAALRWPYWVVTAALPLGFILGGIEYTRCFIKNITNKEIYISSHLKLGENMDEGLNNNEDLKEVEEGKVQS